MCWKFRRTGCNSKNRLRTYSHQASTRRNSMIQLGPPVLAFVIASFIAALELITSKYPRTFFLLKRCPALYIYALIYGVIGLAVMLGLNNLVSQKAVTLE